MNFKNFWNKLTDRQKKTGVIEKLLPLEIYFSAVRKRRLSEKGYKNPKTLRAPLIASI